MHIRLNRKKAVVLMFVLLMAVSGLWICICGYRFVRQQRCFYNMSSLISCLHVYMNDYDGRYPPSHQWCDLLKQEAKAPESDFRCPGDKEGPCSYAMNKNASVYTFGTAPDDLVFIFEASPGWNQAGGKELLTVDYHEGRGCHIMYADLTAAFVKDEDLESLRWE